MRYIGLMSGTSADAVDAVLVEFADGRPRLLATHAEPLPADLRARVLALVRPGANELDRLAQLDGALARLFAQASLTVLEQAGLVPAEVRAIGSHGQTVRHSPGGDEPYTLQLGNPSLIAELTGITVVADFRRRDMAAGGQGAPLAPAFHAAFFQQSAEARAVVNIGGIANVTLLPAPESSVVSGFDTGPGNALLDGWTERHLGLPLDRDGAWGAQGRVLPELLALLLSDPYFALPPPKSTGREYFNLDWLDKQLARWGQSAAAVDVQATLTALTARSIAQAMNRHALAARELLVCGGGVHNPVLMQRIQAELNIPVASTARDGVDPDYLEALGFAWLALRTLEGLPGNLPAVTGARGLRVLGGIYPV